MIQQIQNEPGVPKAVVTWKLPREDVEQDGMTLNMPTLKVTLILKKGKGSCKVLCFENAEDCLRFATAFYNMSPDTANAAEARADETPPLAEISDTASDVNSSVRMESLNDEEQIVLERYRELRQTKPAQDALHQMMSLHDDPKEDDDEELTQEEKQVAQKYREMLGLSLPLGAIQHRMRLDGNEAGMNLPPEIVSAGELPSSPISTFTTTTVGEKSAVDKLTEAEEKVADCYRIMLKRGIPADAVRHKMTRDQVDMKIAASVFASDDGAPKDEVKPSAPAEQTQAQPSGPQLLAEDEAIAEKYRKMLKLMIPAEGVRHKMGQDQVDPKIVAAVLGEEPVLKKKEPPSFAKIKKRAVLSDEEESIASQYRKLLKFHVSKEIVLSRMQKEGVNEKIITAVLGNSTLASKPSEDIKCSGSASTGSSLINLHWNAMEDVPAGSVWETSKNASDPERSDIPS